MNAIRPVLVSSGALLISGLIGTAGLAQAATATLSGVGTCTIGSLSGDGAGNLTITCSGGSPPPPPATSAPACNPGQFSGTVGAVTSITLSCNASTTSANWTQAPGAPSIVPINLGTSASATYPAAGTYVYTVTPLGANNAVGTAVQVSVTIASSSTPPPAAGSADTALCTAYPGGYRDQLSYVLPSGSGTQITSFYTLSSNSSGYAPIAATRLQFGAATGAGKGSIMVNESPTALQGVNKWASISTRPCDFADASAGGTAKWVTHGSSVSIVYTVEDIATEGYITPYAFMPSYREGVRLRAGQTYYLNVVNGGAAWNTPACPAGSNCGVVIEVYKP